jgi:tripeptide aminopeptidase
LRGAREFDLGGLRADRGFVLDHASPIGEVITSAPTYQRLVAEFEGVESHAGMRPEDGRSAIAAAAAAVASMTLGRLDEETTTNVGVIQGGTASNVVAALCRVEGEARSIDSERAAKEAGKLSEACAWGASEHGCDVDVSIEELFRGYRTQRDSAALALAEAGLRRAGLEPTRVATGGGSDANALILKGLDCVLLANGTLANHTPEERVEATELDRMLDVCLAICAEASC